MKKIILLAIFLLPAWLCMQGPAFGLNEIPVLFQAVDEDGEEDEFEYEEDESGWEIITDEISDDGPEGTERTPYKPEKSKKTEKKKSTLVEPKKPQSEINYDREIEMKADSKLPVPKEPEPAKRRTDNRNKEKLTPEQIKEREFEEYIESREENTDDQELYKDMDPQLKELMMKE